jgi:ABC-2 type transport system permease protein
MSRLGEVFRFELEYRLRAPSTWIYAAVLFGLPFVMLNIVNGSSSKLNSPEMVAVITSILSMVGMLVTAALFGDAATRDVQSGMHPLVYTTPLRTWEYLGGRFAGALVVNTVMLLGVPLGQALGAQMPWADPRMFGPFRAASYAQPYLLFLLPNMLLMGAVLFAVAALTRQTVAAHLGAVSILVGNTFAGELAEQVQSRRLAALLDPFGIVAMEDLTRYWTPAQKNGQLLGFPDVLVWNRMIWLAVAVLVLALLLYRFRFAHPVGAGHRRKGRRRVASPEPGRVAPVAVPPVEGVFGPWTRARQTLAVMRRSLEEMAKSRAFAVLLVGMLLFVMMLGWDVGDVVFGTSAWPVTHLMAGAVLAEAASMVMTLLIVIFAGELVWRERDVRMSAIADASPVPDGVALLGRFLALVTLVAVLQAVLIGAGMLLQTLQGYHRYEVGLYLRFLFGIKLADYALLAALAMTVHVVVNQKYLGHVAVILFYLFTVFAQQLGVRHHLLVYGSDPGWIYSDLNGFGPFVEPFVWFKLYWAAWALLLAVVARLFWVRGRERDSRPPLALARARLNAPLLRSVVVAGVLIVGLGGFIFYNTNVLNEYRTPFQKQAELARYERRYKRFEGAPQPSIARAELRIELYPERGAADLRGSYQLVNRTARAIDSVHVLLSREVHARSFRFDRPARAVLADDRLQYRIYVLERALQPRDSLRLAFDVAYRTRGFRNGDIPTAVVRSGAFFDRMWLPALGYQSSVELAGAEDRRRHGLPPLPPSPAPDDPRARPLLADRGWMEPVHVDAVIGTRGEQIAITAGTLRREWRENGRRYFHYRTDAPLPFLSPFLSGEYAVREDRWNDVALRIYHHPAHGVNVPRMFRGLKASLDYNTAAFGPYQFRELRIVEFPRYESFARAYPHTIAFSEGSAFLTRVNEGDVDRPFFVTAHETAHQWWGGQVVGANVRGSALLSESLAQYSAMMVMEKTFGPEQVRRFYDYELDRYLQGRRVFSNREVPLLQVENQSYLYYHKGAVAMYALREHIGEQAVNTALRRYLQKHRAGVPPFPTSLDLYAELRAVTPDSMQSLLHDLFAEITLWNVSATEARVQPAANGAFRVTLDVTASKVRADSIGNETEVPMNDLVEIGVFGPAADGEAGGAPLYLRRHRIRSGRQTITVTVPRRPARAGIDPLNKLIQREAGDNVVDVR